LPSTASTPSPRRPTIYAYDVAGGKASTFFRQSAKVDSGNFTLEQVWYPSKDGTKVPMFVLYKKGLKLDGSHPTYLTGYGGFNQTSLPGFSSTAVAWAENGGVFALANLRGGGEFGEPWHQAGMLDKKQNVFDDFAGAAQYLIAKKYTSAAHLGVAGGSNGGLLVTAMLTQHPDLVKAVVCSYPLIDMLRFQKFLVGSYWVPEYGSADDAEQFKYIYAYSPYQHVKKGTKYPSVLFITGDGRHARVAAARAQDERPFMQASTGSQNPVLLRYHVSGGHSCGEPLNVVVNNAGRDSFVPEVAAPVKKTTLILSVPRSPSRGSVLRGGAEDRRLRGHGSAVTGAPLDRSRLHRRAAQPGAAAAAASSRGRGVPCSRA